MVSRATKQLMKFNWLKILSQRRSSTQIFLIGLAVWVACLTILGWPVQGQMTQAESVAVGRGGAVASVDASATAIEI